MCDGRACPLSADCVAKLFVALRERNNRIRVNASLNQYCVSAFVLESMLLDLVVKIVLQHNRPKADIAPFQSTGLSRYDLLSCASGAIMRRRDFISLLGGAAT